MTATECDRVDRSFQCLPRYATPRTPNRKTLALAAVRLARVMGVELLPWQKMVLEVALEVDERASCKYRAGWFAR